MSYIGIQYPDNATLFNGTLTTAGAGSAINTTGYIQSVWQLSGNTFSGIITAEVSLDGVYWSPTLVTELSSLGQKTQVDVTGVYLVKADAKYIRYNVVNISGSASLLILGNDYLSSNPVDRLSLAMDDTNNAPLNVKLLPQNSGIKQDTQGAFILSDAPQAITIVGVIGSQTIIDTQGYQSVQITTSSYAGNLQGSNDGINYFSILAYNLTSLASISVLTAAGTFSIPAQTRYIRLTGTTTGQFTYQLRNAPTPPMPSLNFIAGSAVNQTTSQLGVNIVNVGGTAAVTGGLAGTLGVGGSGAVGSSPLSSPIVAGGIDPTGLVRRATSTMLGDLITGNRTIPTSNAALGSATTGNTPIGSAGFNNQLPHTIQDTSQYEGQSQVELLAQILQELKILNQQIFELPKIQAAAFQGATVPSLGTIVQLGDEPTQMRNDASLFSQQQ